MRTHCDRHPGELARAVDAWLLPRRKELVAFIKELVELESPSGGNEGLRRASAFLQSHLRDLVREQEVLASAHGEHLVCRFGPSGGRGLLVLGHYDTVWPEGTTRERPVAIDGGHITGPGVFDMKASMAMAIYALRAIEDIYGFHMPVTLSLTPDEEIGNPSSRDAIVALAHAAATVLVLEPPLRGGALKTRRKGVAHVHIDVEGIAAHAGLDSADGASAALEVAHLVLAAADLADVESGTTVNVGMVRAGERRNVVPASGEIVLDVRSWHEAEILRVIASLERATPTIDGAQISVRGIIHRPPMDRQSNVDPILARARVAAGALGMALDEGDAGGGSEANLTARIAPTLDGLGPEGEGAHSVSERVILASLFERTAVLAALIGTEPR